MCLVTKKKEVNIAKRDKTVIKWISRYTDNLSTWSGPIRRQMSFPFNEIVTARDEYGKEIDHLQLCEGCISEGIHSYRIHSLINYLFDSHKIGVIPKGSEYCYGRDGEVVSKEIMVFSSYKKYFRYKWKKLLEKYSRKSP